MIRLGDYAFRYACAAGALGYDGLGYVWERPLRWLGIIDPTRLLVITKTLTMEPRAGHYRWWKPWQTVRLVEGGAVNALGLPNPGLDTWCRKIYPNTVRWPSKNIDIAVSIAPDTPAGAIEMAARIQEAADLWKWGNIRAIELNCSCPNLGHTPTVTQIISLALAVKAVTKLPVIVKLGWQQPFLPICRGLDGVVAAFDLINTVPWKEMYTSAPSPLAKYGHEGGVSGEPIAGQAMEALRIVKQAGVQTPVLSGGGIMTYEDAAVRLRLADAISFGTVFLRAPWRVKNIIRRLDDDAVSV